MREKHRHCNIHTENTTANKKEKTEENISCMYTDRSMKNTAAAVDDPNGPQHFKEMQTKAMKWNELNRPFFLFFSLLFCGFIIYIYFFSFISMVRCLVGFAHSVLLKNGNECTKKTTTDTHKHTEYECFKSILFISIWRTIFFCIFFSFVRSDVLRRSKKKTNVNYSNTQVFFIVHIHTMFSIGMKTKWEKNDVAKCGYFH